MSLPEISIEQLNIINQLESNNVIVDSVAGSGKTTTNLHIAKHYSDSNILLLTYNSRLKIETRHKISKLNLNNIECHSYHSFCVKYYDNKAFTDKTIRKIINNSILSKYKFSYNIIVLDEAQDVTELYYTLICKIVKDNNIIPKIILFGDKNQSIFDFNGADSRFIEYADLIYTYNNLNWIKCNLSTSFRITHEMALFINNCLLNNNRINSNKISNVKPRYIICNTFCDTELAPIEEIKYYTKDLNYKAGDIFVLAPSIKNNISSPIAKFSNKIKEYFNDIMIYAPMSDDEKLDEDVMKDKLVFSTFHQAKGLERKVVIIFGFDNSYFEYYKKNIDPYICPNELYVATTRASEHLTLLHHQNKDFLPFIKDKQNILEYCNVFGNYKSFFKDLNKNIRKPKDKINVTVTQLLKHLPETIIDECIKELNIIRNNNLLPLINIPIKIIDNTTENVSEITGIAIPSLFEYKIKNNMKILNRLLDENFENKSDICTITKDYNLNDIILSDISNEQLLYLSNCWNTYSNEYNFKLYQIQNYNWLSNENLNNCLERINSLGITSNAIFEKSIGISIDNNIINNSLKYNLSGYIDCVDIDNNTIYEFKTVNQLTDVHILQLALYMYMYEQKYNSILHDQIKLLNTQINNKYKLLNNQLELLKLDKSIKYLIGDFVRVTLDIDYIGVITKIYKRMNKLKIKCKDKILEVPKESTIEVLQRKSINNISQKINKIKLSIQKLQEEIDELNNKISTRYILFNILTNETIEIKYNKETVEKIIYLIIVAKYNNKCKLDNDDFINKTKTIYNKYF